MNPPPLLPTRSLKLLLLANLVLGLVLLCLLFRRHPVVESGWPGELKAQREQLHSERKALEVLILQQTLNIRRLEQQDSLIAEGVRNNRQKIDQLKTRYHENLDTISRYDGAALRRAYANLQD